MNLPNTQNIVHESETQRQFVRLPVPAQVVIDEQDYEAGNLSSGGLSVEGVKNAFQPGTHLSLLLRLPFTAFSLEITIEAEVLYFDSEKQVMGCQFVNVTPDQVSLLNHVMKSYMAGEIVKSGDLLNVAARENFVNPRKKASTRQVPVVSIGKQIPRLLLVGLLGLAAAAFIAGNIYDSLFVLKSNDSVVQGPEVQVRAVTQGVFVSKLPPYATEVKNRQELGSVNGDDVKSPCDCFITEIHRQDGEFVIAGDPVVSLVPKESAPWILSTLKLAEASRLDLGNKAKISVTGTKTEVVGKVASIKANTSRSDAYFGPRMVQVRVVPENPLPIDLVGRPAKVVFDVE